MEIELKFPVPPSFRRHLSPLGFRVVRPPTRVTNWLFDDARGSLRKSGKLLRLRHAGPIWLLTAKGPRLPGVLKRRAEHQTAVADGPATRRLLALAGFQVVGSYSLTRTLLRRPGERGELAWDHTRLGSYLEIEGSAAWVRRTAAQLGLHPADAEPRSYPDLLISARPSRLPTARR